MSDTVTFTAFGLGFLVTLLAFLAIKRACSTLFIPTFFTMPGFTKDLQSKSMTLNLNNKTQTITFNQIEVDLTGRLWLFDKTQYVFMLINQNPNDFKKFEVVSKGRLLHNGEVQLYVEDNNTWVKATLQNEKQDDKYLKDTINTLKSEVKKVTFPMYSSVKYPYFLGGYQIAHNSYNIHEVTKKAQDSLDQLTAIKERTEDLKQSVIQTQLNNQRQ